MKLVIPHMNNLKIYEIYTSIFFIVHQAQFFHYCSHSPHFTFLSLTLSISVLSLLLSVSFSPSVLTTSILSLSLSPFHFLFHSIFSLSSFFNFLPFSPFQFFPSVPTSCTYILIFSLLTYLFWWRVPEMMLIGDPLWLGWLQHIRGPGTESVHHSIFWGQESHLVMRGGAMHSGE